MRRLLLWFVVVAALPLGCGTDDALPVPDTTGDAPDAAAPAADTAQPPDGPALDARREDAADGAAGAADVQPGAMGAACEGDLDCDAGLLCIVVAGEGICTRTCLTDCPPGWHCRAGEEVEGGLLSVCLPPGSLLCQPCGADARCGGGLCLSLDDGRRCTRPCDAARPCPAGYDCLRTTSEEDDRRSSDQCVPRSAACDCGAANDGEERLCLRSNALGTCLGLEVCDAELGWRSCSAGDPAAEVCNGADDDCDGIADEDVTPPADACVIANEHGTCVGAWVCTGTEGWLCTATEPAPDDCNYLDDDCDGATDEDARDPVTGAYVALQHCGACGNDCNGRFPNAVARCDAALAEPTCAVDHCLRGYVLAGPTACVALADNLCEVCGDDAGCGGPGDRCLDLDGGRWCGRDCAEGNLHGTGCPPGFDCVEVAPGAEQCVPQSGSCTCRTGAHAGAARPCFRTNESGTCAGVEECDPALGWSACTAATPAAETCNGADDDCDGLRDEDLTPPAAPCELENQWGRCAGAWSCAEGAAGSDWACDARTPTAETCNGVDDDCSGATDEPFRLGPAGPYAALHHCGACGVTCLDVAPFVLRAECTVVDGVPGCHVVQCEPGYFQPPGLDLCVPYGPAFDCSPCSADANCAALPGACLALDGGSFCAADCTADGDCPERFACADTPAGRQCVPATGSCSCWHPDHEGLLRACYRTNELGTCTGLQTCAADGGWSACTAGDALPETCNGRDDDCDGLLDEDVAPPAAPCESANEHGTCTGTWRCESRSGVTDWACDVAEPRAEQCDGRDDDCDGATDEDFRDPDSGDYVALEHCGACGTSCEGFVPFAAETACALRAGERVCVVVDCEDGYFRPEGFELCVPLAGASDCTPCAEDERCALLPGVCLPLGDGRYCARNCGGLEDCPPGFLCSDGHCLPPSGSCSCLPGAEDVVRTCLRTSAFGVCVGEESCDPLAGWSPCSAAEPAVERCNGADDDCDGQTDEPGALDCTPFFRDGDEDGFGVATDVLCLCSPGFGHTAAAGGDCDDADGDVHPGAAEQCNGKDDDCEGAGDEDGAAGCLVRWRDDDRDGFGVEGRLRCLCAPAAPWDATQAGDCDDTAPAIHPAATETCNGVDDDCADGVDEAGAEGCRTWWADADHDDWGDPAVSACLCAPDLAHPVDRAGDCDDGDPAAHPGGTEVCGPPAHPADEDCDGATDEADALGCSDWWVDEDADGFGVPLSDRCLCGPDAPATAPQGGDCDDDDAGWTPLAAEACAAAADCCRAAAVCRAGRCLAPPATCAAHDDCGGDTFCDGAECLPWGLPPLGAADPDCEILRLPTTLLPERQCEWAGPPEGDPWPDHGQVLGQPVVVDLDLDDDPATVRPSLVFVAWAGTQDDTSPNPGDGPGADPALGGVLRVVDGATCALQATAGQVRLVGAGTPAAADLDGDGRPELLALRAGGGVAAFRWDAAAGALALVWEGHDAGGAVVTTGAGVLRWSGPTVTDLDGDAAPEVLVGAVVFGADGLLLGDNLGFKGHDRGPVPVVSDVDRDGAPELVTGDGVWRWAPAGGGGSWVRETWSAVTGAGYVAVADFGSYAVTGLPTTIPEVAVVTPGSTGGVRLQRLGGASILAQTALPYHPPVSGPGGGGPPSIGDVDGDGRPEIVVAAAGGLTVFDPACAGTSAPFGCARPGILWTIPLHDVTSGGSVPTLFDFQDDGLLEVVVADECFLRVVRGTDGRVLFSTARSSGTFLDGPVVADTDGDGRAEIVVVENGSTPWLSCPATDPIFPGLRCARNSDCPGGPCLLGLCRCEDDGDCGATGDHVCRPPHPNTPGTDPVCQAAGAPRRAGVTVWRDRDDTWAATRPIWNQHAYFVTNVADDGTVPAFGESGARWLTAGGNDFRRNAQGVVHPTPLPDLTVRPGVAGNCDEDGLLALDALVCNRGAAATDGPVTVAFYRGDPAAGRVLCAPGAGALAPGECAPVLCSFAPGDGGTTVTVVADVALEHEECREDNSAAVFADLTCRNLP